MVEMEIVPVVGREKTMISVIAEGDVFNACKRFFFFLLLFFPFLLISLIILFFFFLVG